MAFILSLVGSVKLRDKTVRPKLLFWIRACVFIKFGKIIKTRTLNKDEVNLYLLVFRTKKSRQNLDMKLVFLVLFTVGQVHGKFTFLIYEYGRMYFWKCWVMFQIHQYECIMFANHKNNLTPNRATLFCLFSSAEKILDSYRLDKYLRVCTSLTSCTYVTYCRQQVNSELVTVLWG